MLDDDPTPLGLRPRFCNRCQKQRINMDFTMGSSVCKLCVKEHRKKVQIKNPAPAIVHYRCNFEKEPNRKLDLM